MERHDREACPACGGPLVQLKCKVVGRKCHARVANCNGD